MTELELYKFIEEFSVEYHWGMNDNIKDVVIMPYSFNLDDLEKLIESFIIDQDEGLEIVLKHGYVCVWMKEICEWYDIELEKVFEKTNEDKRMIGEYFYPCKNEDFIKMYDAVE